MIVGLKQIVEAIVEGKAAEFSSYITNAGFCAKKVEKIVWCPTAQLLPPPYEQGFKVNKLIENHYVNDAWNDPKYDKFIFFFRVKSAFECNRGRPRESYAKSSTHFSRS